MTAAACLAALLAAAPARADEKPLDCPAGTHRAASDNPYEPFRCAAAGDENPGGLDPAVGANAFATRPRCPLGTRPLVETGKSLQPYRCVPASSGVSQPGPARDAAERYSIPGQISFDYPSAFRVQDAWKEEVPTLYLQIDGSGAGKPVTITVTRCAEGQNGYESMSEAIARDVEWQGAKDAGEQALGRSRARVTSIPGDTRSVYLPASKDSYYSFVYSAPAGLYETYLPAFTRLLKSLKLAGSAP